MKSNKILDKGGILVEVLVTIEVGEGVRIVRNEKEDDVHKSLAKTWCEDQGRCPLGNLDENQGLCQLSNHEAQPENLEAELGTDDCEENCQQKHFNISNRRLVPHKLLRQLPEVDAPADDLHQPTQLAVPW